MFFHSSDAPPERPADPAVRRANLRRIGPLFAPYKLRLGGVLLLIVVSAGLGVVEDPEYIVLGTIDRRAWRRGLVGDAQFADIRDHLADFKKYLKVDVIPAHRELSNRNAG